MNIRWLWGDYIEPEWRLSRAESREVHRIVKKRHVRSARLFGVTIFWLVILFSAVRLLHMPAAGWMSRLGYPLSWIVSMLVILVPLMVAAMWSFRIVYTRPVRMAMRELGYDVCPNCGYSLRGLEGEDRHCPECGAAAPGLSPPS